MGSNLFLPFRTDLINVLAATVNGLVESLGLICLSAVVLREDLCFLSYSLNAVGSVSSCTYSTINIKKHSFNMINNCFCHTHTHTHKTSFLYPLHSTL